MKFSKNNMFSSLGNSLSYMSWKDFTFPAIAIGAGLAGAFGVSYLLNDHSYFEAYANTYAKTYPFLLLVNYYIKYPKKRHQNKFLKENFNKTYSVPSIKPTPKTVAIGTGISASVFMGINQLLYPELNQDMYSLGNNIETIVEAITHNQFNQQQLSPEVRTSLKNSFMGVNILGLYSYGIVNLTKKIINVGEKETKKSKNMLKTAIDEAGLIFGKNISSYKTVEKGVKINNYLGVYSKKEKNLIRASTLLLEHLKETNNQKLSDYRMSSKTELSYFMNNHPIKEKQLELFVRALHYKSRNISVEDNRIASDLIETYGKKIIDNSANNNLKDLSILSICAMYYENEGKIKESEELWSKIVDAIGMDTTVSTVDFAPGTIGVQTYAVKDEEDNPFSKVFVEKSTPKKNLKSLTEEFYLSRILFEELMEDKSAIEHSQPIKIKTTDSKATIYFRQEWFDHPIIYLNNPDISDEHKKKTFQEVVFSITQQQDILEKQQKVSLQHIDYKEKIIRAYENIFGNISLKDKNILSDMVSLVYDFGGPIKPVLDYHHNNYGIYSLQKQEENNIIGCKTDTQQKGKAPAILEYVNLIEHSRNELSKNMFLSLKNITFESFSKTYQTNLQETEIARMSGIYSRMFSFLNAWLSSSRSEEHNRILPVTYNMISSYNEGFKQGSLTKGQPYENSLRQGRKQLYSIIEPLESKIKKITNS
ncbi:MAG: hypothetical protein ACQESC_00495 [Nanobdellota archaeon]